MKHPLDLFKYCPKCGHQPFEIINEKAKHCTACNFTYYLNPSTAVACFIKNKEGELLVVRRAKEPAKGTLDLPGGFADMNETIEEVVRREIKEETGLEITNIRYLFSLPNIYPYSGFEVHTLDMFFECEADSFEGAVASDDVDQLFITNPHELDPSLFGLISISKAITLYKQGKY